MARNSSSMNFLFTLGIFFHFASAISAEVILLYSQPNGEGDSLELNVEKCIVLPRGWNDRVSSVNSNGHCFELFDNKHCNGPSVRVEPEGQRVGVTNLGDMEFESRTGSIKPCVRMVKPGLWSRGGYTVTVYELVDRAGLQADVKIEGGCANIPAALYKNSASVNTRGKCVRLYDEPNCEGSAIQLQANDPNSDNLHFVDFIDKASSAGPCLGRFL